MHAETRAAGARHRGGSGRQSLAAQSSSAFGARTAGRPARRVNRPIPPPSCLAYSSGLTVRRLLVAANRQRRRLRGVTTAHSLNVQTGSAVGADYRSDTRSWRKVHAWAPILMYGDPALCRKS